MKQPRPLTYIARHEHLMRSEILWGLPADSDERTIRLILNANGEVQLWFSWNVQEEGESPRLLGAWKYEEQGWYVAQHEDAE